MGEADARSDEDLMRASAAGDLAAFDALVRRYERRVLSYAYRVLGDYQTACDIFQQTFLNIFEKRRQYRAAARFSTYVYCIAHNLCQNELRRLQRRRAASLERPTPNDEGASVRQWLADDEPEPAEPASRHEEQALLREAIARLDPMYREVIALRIFEDLPFKDIADITGVNESTAKSRLRYALAYLDKALRKKLGGKP